MTYCFPYLISFLIGLLAISLLLQDQKKINLPLRLSLALGIGLSISAHIIFFGFVIFDKLHRPFVLTIHFCLLALLFIGLLSRWKTFTLPKLNLRKTALEILLGLGLIVTILYVLWTQANFYPYGGWDAWSVWNFKSKFLYLGGQDWKNMFDPILWRSSQHYPLLLPLTNVWGWIFFKEPTPMIPLINSILFTFMTVALLYSGLKIFVKSTPALLAALLLVSPTTFITYATSQYCDIVIAYLLLAGLVCLILAKLNRAKVFAFLAGLFLGFLSFTKPEGTLASALIVGLSVPFFFNKNEGFSARTHPLTFLGIGLILGLLPTILFHILYAPANQTFINGLNSSTHPVTMERFKIIMLYFASELMSKKWCGLWALLFIGLLLSHGRCFKRENLLLCSFLGLYGLLTCFYYWLNTYFEIGWWLTVTLPRVLLAILPIMIFWVFYSLWGENAEEQPD